MLVDDDRRALHRLAARWLESAGETEPVVLARHFEEAGEADQARAYYGRAGQRALAEGNPEQAVRWLQTSLVEAVTDPEHQERSLGLGRALVLLGRYDEAWSAIDALASAEGRLEAEAALLRARILRGQRRLDEAERAIRATLERLDDKAHPDILFGLLHTLFWVIWVQGKYQVAGGVANQLFSAAAADAQPERLGLAELAMSYFQAVEGDLSVAVDLADKAVAHARELGHPYRETDGLMLLGSLQEMVGLHTEARASLDAALALAMRLKTMFHQAMLTIALSRVLLAQEHVAAALEGARVARQLADELGDRRTKAMALASSANALVARHDEGDLVEARAAAAQALELSRDKLPPVEAEVRWVLCRIALARNETAEAVEHAQAAKQLLDGLGTHELYEIQILLAIHDALEAAGRGDEAREMLQRAGHVLRARARRIGDEALRERFLALPHNARVRSLSESAQ